MNRHLLRLLVVSTFLVAGSASAQQLIYLRAGAVGGDGQCGTPYGNLRAALTDAAGVGGPVEIRIAQGTYSAPEDRDNVINFSDVTLKGGYGATFGGCASEAAIEGSRVLNTPALTTFQAGALGRHLGIIPVRDDPDGIPNNGDETFLSANDNIVIDDVTFLNGRPGAPGAGGSIVILNCNVTITNSVFQDNTTNDHFFGGGAIYHVGYATAGPQFNAAILDLDNVIFDGNQTGRALSGSGPGGAIFASDINVDAGPPLTLRRSTVINASNCVFRDNWSNGSGNIPIDPYCLDAGGAPAGNADCDGIAGNEGCRSRSVGGAVYLANISGDWDNNQFIDNQSRANQTEQTDASGMGGAIATFSSTAGRGANPRITNNLFQGNTADAGRGAEPGCGYFSAWGGAAYLVYFNTEFSGNTLNGNIATATGNSAPQGGWGGGLMMIPETITAGVEPLIDDNDFIANEAIGGGGRLAGWGGGMLTHEFNINASPQITNNTFDGNSVIGARGGTAYGGGLMVDSGGFATLIGGNTFTNNIATGVGGQFSGCGGGLYTQIGDPDQLIADNIFTNNQASSINAQLTLAGATLFARVLDDISAAPRVQNNLFTGNDGTALATIGFPTAGPDGDINQTADNVMAFSSPMLLHNTIDNNDGYGLLSNLSDEMLVESNIITNNGRVPAGAGDVRDQFLTPPRDGNPNSIGQVVRYSVIQRMTNAAPDFQASANDPDNNNWIGLVPAFAVGPAGTHYLQQPPDNGGTPNQLVDAGPELASAVDFGANPRYAGVTMNDRTTRTGAGPGSGQSPDTCFVDIGFHHRLTIAAPDGDSDGLSDADEAAIGTDPGDADTDNDGVVDGSDCGGDIDGDGTVAALDCDTDGDALTDGTEVGITTAERPAATADDTCDTSNSPCGSATNPSFTPDGDDRTTTDMLDRDTDGGGEPDGCEDEDHDGRFESAAGERNPNVGQDSDDDQDQDGISNGIEFFLNTSDSDLDSDDDGIGDRAELDGTGDPNYDSDPANCDTDFDFLLDGVETSRGPVLDPDGPAFPIRGTDCAPDPTRCALPDGFCGPDNTVGTADDGDQDPTTQTYTPCQLFPNCEGYDTDGDTCGDGDEDNNPTDPNDPDNHNGRFDGAPETNPLANDCSSGGGPITVNINDQTTALRSSNSAACGMLTDITADAIMATACNAPLFDCNAAASLATVTRTTSVTPGTPTTLPGEARDSFEPGVLVYYELRDCANNIYLRKSGTALVLTAGP